MYVNVDGIIESCVNLWIIKLNFIYFKVVFSLIIFRYIIFYNK